MDLSVMADWVQVLGGIQLLPATVASVRDVLAGSKHNKVSEDLSQQLAQLVMGFRIISELKELHDESQILHNSFQKVRSFAVDGPGSVQISDINRIWRDTRASDFARFYGKTSALIRIQPIIPKDDIESMVRSVEALGRAISEYQVRQIVEHIDAIQERIVSILTIADVALKTAINDVHDNVLTVERGISRGK